VLAILADMTLLPPTTSELAATSPPSWLPPLRRAQSEIARWAADIDALPAAQQRDFTALEQALRLALEAADASPGAVSAHDLANTLSAVKGYAELLADEILGSPMAEPIARLLTAFAEPPPNAVSAPSADRPAGRVLVIDDWETNRDLAQRYLVQNGHQVTAVGSGEEGLQILSQQSIDLILLDLLMPGMDGREVLTAVKANPEWRAIPVIVISGSQDMSGIIACIEAGADDYLFKPFNPVLLQARITAGLERKRWHDLELSYQRQLERNERFIRATFGRYLSDDIVADILERPEGLELGGRLRKVTLMMSDLCGFTQLSQEHPPATVVTLLNRYLGRMTDIIMAHGGTIDEFIGDAIFAAFGAPKDYPDAADRAANCALTMQAAMVAINQENVREGLPEISMGIALNTGEVIAGNIGSERRSKYGFVGHPVNVTARIEDFSGAGDILISGSTRAELQGHYRFGEAREELVKGIHTPITIIPMLGRDAP
jgi:adenylate cyclase